MNFKIDPQILAEFPAVTLGVAGVKGIDNCGDNPELGQLLKAAGFSLRLPVRQKELL